MATFIFSIVVFVAAIIWAAEIAYSNGRRAGQKFQESYDYIVRGRINSRRFASALAKHLEIQADGGDDPVEFVEYAINQSLADMRALMTRQPEGGSNG